MSNIIVSGLFTSVTQTSYDIYEALSKSKKFKEYNIELAASGAVSCGDCDILICSSYNTLLGLKEYLNKDMTIIVCDGPLITSCLTTATPLDHVRRMSYKFEFRPINYDLLIPALRKKGPQVALLADKYDVLGLVTSNSVSGSLILQELNKVLSYFDALARNRLRFLFIEVLTATDPKPALQALNAFLKKECVQSEHRDDAGKFWAKLIKGGAASVLRKCMRAKEGKNLAVVAKKFNVSPYELTYITKMARNLDTAAARTATYNERTKTMQAAG